MRVGTTGPGLSAPGSNPAPDDTPTGRAPAEQNPAEAGGNDGDVPAHPPDPVGSVGPNP